MAIDSIGAAGVNNNTAAQAAGVSQEDFFRILVAQLSFQDPLKPIDNQAFIAQIAQFTALEQSRQTNDNMTALLTVQSTTQAVGLIGRTVEVTTDAGQVIGTVTTLNFNQGRPQMTIRTPDGAFLFGIGLGQIATLRD
jgi:flagellar basal-body rod modification protein FlgD